jgi:hypothetical protein
MFKNQHLIFMNLCPVSGITVSYNQIRKTCMDDVCSKHRALENVQDLDLDLDSSGLVL